MNRREFAQSALATAGLGSVAVTEIEKPASDEVLLLTIPHGHSYAEQTAQKMAVQICERFHCDVIVMPDIMKLERISKADAERLIQHIVRISEKTESGDYANFTAEDVAEFERLQSVNGPEFGVLVGSSKAAGRMP